MSTQVDHRVVEMKFDNKQFEQNVSTTMSSLDKLKQKLNLSGATKGLEEVDKAAKKVDMNGLGNAVETVRVKFSALQVMGITALTNLTNSAVNAGKRITKALTIDPIKTGFEEYETQINAVQTIFSNVKGKGKSLDDVNNALDELNTYADKTIYNFTEMTKNIGTFTAAGVGLDESVASIKGIANLAAVSGSTSQQASTAMYQLSQALAAGKVSLMDWNSVVNAGMGGEIFQNALRRTSEAMGTGAEAAIKEFGSFRESLTSSGWLTAEVLTETLNQISGAYTEADLVAQGYTEKQAKEIAELAETATSAAQDVKTFTQLWDTLKETAQSGWTNTWEIIVGDYLGAKNMWSKVYKALSGPIEKMGERRNNMLENALGSGDDLWAKYIKQINKAGIKTEQFQKALIKTAKKHGASTKQMEKAEESFNDSLKDGWLTKDIIVETLQNYVDKSKTVSKSTEDMKDKLKTFQKVFDDVWRGSYKNGEARVKALTEAGFEYNKVQDLVNKHSAGYKLTLDDISDSQLKNVGYTKEQIKALRDLANEAGDSSISIDELVASFDRVDGRTLLIEALGNFAGEIGKIFEAIGEAWENIFREDDSGTNLYGFIEQLHKLSESFKISETAANNFKKVFEGLFAIFQLSNGIIYASLNTFIKIIGSILSAFDTDLLSVAAKLGEYAVKLRDWVKENTVFIGTIDKIGTAIANVIRSVIDFVKALYELEPVQDWLGEVGKHLKTIFDTIMGLASGSSILSTLETFFENLTKWMKQYGEMNPEEWKEVGWNIVQGLIKGIQNGISSLIVSIFELGKIMLDTIREVLGIHSPSTEAIEIGINFVEGLIKGIGSLIPVLFETIRALCEGMMVALQEFDIDIGALAIFGVVIAMLVLANKIVKIMDRVIKPMESFKDRMADLLEGIGGHLNKYIDAKAFQAKAEAIKSIAISLLILVGALYLMQNIDVKKVWMPLLALAAMVGILVGLAFAMTKLGDFKDWAFAKISLLMLSLAVSLTIMADAIVKLAKLNFGDAMGAVLELTIIIGALTALMIAYGKFVNGPAAKDIWQAGTMLTQIAVGIVVMTYALKYMGSLKSEQMKSALNTMGLIGLIFAGFIAISSLAGQHANKAGTMLMRMAIAFGVLALAMHIMAALEPDEIKKALTIIGYVGIVFAAFIAVSTFAGKYAARAGFMLLEISMAMGILALTIRMLAKTSKEDLKKGLRVLREVMHMFTTFMIISLFAGKNAGKAGLLLLGMAGAIAILGIAIKIIGTMSEQDIKRGMVVISLFSAWCAAFMVLSVYAGANASKAGTMLFKMSMAILILVAAIALLSLLKPEDIKIATIAISALIGMFALLVAATKYAQDCMKSLIVMSVAIALLGTTLILLARLDPKNVATASAAMSSLVGTFALLTVASKFATKGSIGTLITMTVIIGLLGHILKKLAKLDPQSVIGAATGISILLTALAVAFRIISVPGATITPTAIIALGVTIVAIGLIGAVLGILQKLNVEPSIETATALSILLLTISGACLLLAAVGATGPAALIGAAILDGVIVILGGLLIGIGALMTYVPAVEEFLDKGITVLEKIGYGLGSILGGFSEGLTSGLPGIGENLGEFMDNAKPFFDTVKNIDDKTVSSVQALADSILTLVKADFADQFTFGSSLGSFGDQLVPFGESIVAFSNTVSSLDETAITGIQNSAKAAKAITEVANNIPDSKALFSNEHDMVAFASQLTPFAEGLVSYAKAVSGLDESAITGINTTVSAAKGLAELADAIPDSEALFSNENNLADFGTQLAPFGRSLTGFLSTISSIDESSVTKIDASIAASKGLVKLADSIPDSKGLFSDKNNLGSFGNKLKSFGSSLAEYAASVSGIDAAAIDTSVSAVGKLVKMFNKMSKIDTSGVDNFKSGLRQLGKTSVSDFTSGFDGSTSKLTNAGSNMVKAVKTGISSRKATIATAGKELASELAKGINANQKLVLEKINTMMSKADQKIDGYYDNFFASGKYVVEGFANGITDKTWMAEARARAMANAAERAAKNELDVNSPSKVFRKLGYSIPEGLAQGIDRLSRVSNASARDMANSAINTVSGAISRISESVNSDIDSQPTIRPVMDLSDVRSGANAINDMLNMDASMGMSSNVSAINSMMSRRSQNGTNNDVVSAIDKLRKGLNNVGGTTYNSINGVTYNGDSDVAAAIELITRAAIKGRRV